MPRRFESIDSVEWIVQPAIARYTYISSLGSLPSFRSLAHLKCARGRCRGGTRPLEEALALINNRRFAAGRGARVFLIVLKKIRPRADVYANSHFHARQAHSERLPSPEIYATSHPVLNHRDSRTSRSSIISDFHAFRLFAS